MSTSLYNTSIINIDITSTETVQELVIVEVLLDILILYCQRKAFVIPPHNVATNLESFSCIEYFCMACRYDFLSLKLRSPNLFQHDSEDMVCQDCINLNPDLNRALLNRCGMNWNTRFVPGIPAGHHVVLLWMIRQVFTTDVQSLVESLLRRLL